MIRQRQGWERGASRCLKAIGTLALLSALIIPAPYARAYEVPGGATTEPASVLGPTKAKLEGIINANGTPVSWQFQYGPSTAYDNATPVQTSVGGGQRIAVSWPLTGLIPLTVYHFRLVAFYPGVTATGDDLSFTTAAAGWVRLEFAHLKVTHRHLEMPLRCDSQTPCAGRFLITSRDRVGHRRPISVICSTGSFKLAAKETKRVRAAVDRHCLKRLDKHRGHRIDVQVTATPTTGQFAFIKTVPLSY